MKATRAQWTFVLAAIASALTQISADMYLPALPAISHSLQAQISHVQLTITTFTIGLMCGQFIYGPLSDSFGRRYVLLGSLILLTLSSLLCSLASGVGMLIGARLVQGLGAAGGTTLIRSIIRDMYSGTKYARMSGYVGIFNILPIAMAPLLGGYVQTFLGWRAIFLLLTIAAFLSLVAVMVIFIETNLYSSRANMRPQVLVKNTRQLLTDPDFLAYTLAGMFAFGMIFAWLTAGPVLLQNSIGLTPRQYGEVYFVGGLMLIVGMFAYTRLVKHFHLHSLLVGGLGLTFIAGISLLIFYLINVLTVYSVVLPIMLMFLGLALVFPTTGTLALAPFPEKAGMAGGLFGSLRIIGASLVSGILAFAPENSQLPMASAIIVCSLLSWSAYRVLAYSSSTDPEN